MFAYVRVGLLRASSSSSSSLMCGGPFLFQFINEKRKEKDLFDLKRHRLSDCQTTHTQHTHRLQIDGETEYNKTNANSPGVVGIIRRRRDREESQNGENTHKKIKVEEEMAI